MFHLRRPPPIFESKRIKQDEDAVYFAGNSFTMLLMQILQLLKDS